MSPESASAVAISWRRQAFISRGRQTGLIVGCFSFLLFSAVSARLASYDYIVPAIHSIWKNAGSASQIGGQWATQLIIILFQLIPGSSERTLSVIAIIPASLLLGFIAHDLVKRGCPPWQAALAVGLFALHPVMLYIATSGSLILTSAIIASLTIIALDRLEAIGDTQSLIVMGLSVALMFLTWPNAVFFVIPLALLLPLAFRSGGSAINIVAMYLIVAAPSLIAIGAVAIGGIFFELSWNEIAANWLSPLHGAPTPVVLQSAWLNTYGGRPIAALVQLAVLCAVLMPFTLIIFVRLITQRSERRRPVTGLAALLTPPVMGALATWFWQINSAWVVIAVSMLSCFAWAATVRFRSWERWFWIVGMFCGVLTSWLSPLLWVAPEFIKWRQIILVPISF